MNVKKSEVTRITIPIWHSNNVGKMGVIITINNLKLNF